MMDKEGKGRGWNESRNEILRKRKQHEKKQQLEQSLSRRRSSLLAFSVREGALEDC